MKSPFTIAAAFCALAVSTLHAPAAWADNAVRIVGSWKVTKAEGSMASSNKGQTYTFNSDGSMNVSRVTKGTYKVEGDTVRLTFGAIKMAADISFPQDDTMIYKLRNSDQVFTMEKQ